MPLLDHFHPPIANLRHWESFHAVWATEIMRTLNRDVLPQQCFAEAQVHVGSRVEIDVATFEEKETSRAKEVNSNGGLATKPWAPPVVTAVMSAVFPDEIEIQIFQNRGGAILVAAIALISPGNKDRAETRRAFACKCASYLQQGIGLIIVDIVTDRQTNLHNELIQLLEQNPFKISEETTLYTVAYRPSRQKDTDQIEIWKNPLELGQSLPVMPLALREVATVPLDLETTYTTTCQDCRL